MESKKTKIKTSKIKIDLEKKMEINKCIQYIFKCINYFHFMSQ